MLVPLLEPPGDPDGPALVVVVHGGQIAVVDVDEVPRGGVFLGTFAGRHAWAVDADADLVDRLEAVPRDLRQLWGPLDEATWHLAGRGLQLVEWQRTHRFCGRCGTPTEEAAGERARRCPSCRLLAYPRLAPAVICLVERDDGRALLARGRTFPIPMWSCLAGFVEPGETLEQAVAREVKEEVAVEVDQVTYVASQPWPFPHSLMLGFTARWTGGDIVCDPGEIVDAGWYAPDDLPPIPPPMSIARSLIDAWVARADQRER